MLELPKINMRCDGAIKVRSSGYFKCGRCGDAYTASPLVNPPWDQSHDTWDRSHDARASKKRKISSDGPKEQPPEYGKNYLSGAYTGEGGFKCHRISGNFEGKNKLDRFTLLKCRQKLPNMATLIPPKIDPGR